MPEQLNGAVIGCGFFAQNHLHAWREIDGVHLRAVCDLDGAKAQAAGQAFAVDHVYTDANRLFEEQALDFVDIVTTMETHRVLVELAARHQVATIVQKPFAPSMDDARAMVDACSRDKTPLMVHENFRWQTPLRSVYDVVQSGDIGEPFFGRVSFRHGNPVGYENQPYLFEQEQYIINDVGVHLLDLARFYFGEVTQVFTQTQRVNTRFKGEDVATLLLRHHSGATSIADLSVSTQTSPDPFPQTLVCVEGTKGSVVLTQDYCMNVTRSGAAREYDVSPKYHSWAEQPWDMVQDSVVNIQRHFIDCLRRGIEPETSGADNLTSLGLVFSAYESAQLNRPVVTT